MRLASLTPAVYPKGTGEPNTARPASTNAIDVPAATSMNPGPEAGAYKLTTVATYVRVGTIPDEIAGFVEGPVVQLYDAS